MPFRLRWILPWPLLVATLSAFSAPAGPGLLRDSEILLAHRARMPAGRSHVAFFCRGFEVRDGRTWAVGNLQVLLRVSQDAGEVRVERKVPVRLPVGDIRLAEYQPRAYPLPVVVTRMRIGGTAVEVGGIVIDLPPGDTVWFGTESVQAGVRAALARGTRAFLVEALHGLDFGAAPEQVPVE